MSGEPRARAPRVSDGGSRRSLLVAGAAVSAPHAGRGARERVRVAGVVGAPGPQDAPPWSRPRSSRRSIDRLGVPRLRLTRRPRVRAERRPRPRLPAADGLPVCGVPWERPVARFRRPWHVGRRTAARHRCGCRHAEAPRRRAGRRAGSRGWWSRAGRPAPVEELAGGCWPRAEPGAVVRRIALRALRIRRSSLREADGANESRATVPARRQPQTLRLTRLAARQIRPNGWTRSTPQWRGVAVCSRTTPPALGACACLPVGERLADEVVGVSSARLVSDSPRG
jgi:hypothetical protein